MDEVESFSSTKFSWAEKIHEWEETYKNMTKEQRSALYETRPKPNTPEEN